ncbi:MAG: D-2-hydroxyacid dehydrogenase, partial [Anaerolineae bacterium]|nr:D-2-hydroxyacid dehydrogenase [Anaerolineae bacterium]
VVLSRETIGQLPELEYIGVLATGYNIVDVAAARERGIPVANVPTYGTQSVAQMVFAHLLNLTQHVAYHAQTVLDGRWSESPDFCYWDYPLMELADRSMGIVGFGRIGRATANLAVAFGMNVLAYDVFEPAEVPSGVEMADLDRLFSESDVVSLHVPLTPETDGMVNTERLAMMKPTSFLINTSRGPLVDEQALADALNAGRLAGAGLDVLAVEPADPNNPLMGARNCYITPHISWATRSARSRLLNTAIENVGAFLARNPQNVVN